MFCNNCGQPIDDDRDLCEQCEKAAANKAYNKSFTFDDQAEDIHVEETEEYGYDNEIPYADYELNDSAKHSKPNVARIIGIAAAICVVAVLIALFWRPLFGLFFPLLHFDTPQEHFAFLEKEDAKKFASFITASYEKTITGYEKKYPVNQYRAHILLGDQAQDLLGSYLFNDDANVDISWLSDILIDVDTTEDEGLSEAVVTVGLGEDKVLSADLIVDTSKYILWAAIPELSKHYLEFDLDTLFEEYYGQSVEESGLFADKNLQYLSALPSGQVVYQLAMKYLDIALGKITDVQSTEQTVTIGSMSRECTALTATIPEKTLIEIFICLMETLKEDEVILGAMQDLADLSGENPDKIKEDFIEQINTSIADLQNSLTEAKDTNYLQWTDYVENEINLIGRRITISDSEREFYYLAAKIWRIRSMPVMN